MSTLKATNIKNESSASNNIVLDSGGGVVVSGITTFSNSVQVNSGAYVSGSLGIGITNPSYKLSVVGDINLTGSLYQNGVLFAGGTSAARVYFSSNS